jgi:hypothetical protein
MKKATGCSRARARETVLQPECVVWEIMREAWEESATVRPRLDKAIVRSHAPDRLQRKARPADKLRRFGLVEADRDRGGSDMQLVFLLNLLRR